MTDGAWWHYGNFARCDARCRTKNLQKRGENWAGLAGKPVLFSSGLLSLSPHLAKFLQDAWRLLSYQFETSLKSAEPVLCLSVSVSDVPILPTPLKRGYYHRFHPNERVREALVGSYC